MVASDGWQVFDCGGHGAFGSYGNKEVLEPCYLRAEKSAILLTPFSRNARQKRTLEFILFEPERFRINLSLHSICWLLNSVGQIMLVYCGFCINTVRLP